MVEPEPAQGTGTTLTWASSTDNIGIAGYEIHRAPGATGGTFTQVGTSTAATFTDTGLAPGTTYRYQVRARARIEPQPAARPATAERAEAMRASAEAGGSG